MMKSGYLETFKSQGQYLPKPVFQSAYVALANAYFVKYQQGDSEALNKSVRVLGFSSRIRTVALKLWQKNVIESTELQSHARDQSLMVISVENVSKSFRLGKS